MLLRYRFRLYPTRPQRIALSRAFGCARVVFNDTVAARRLAHAEGLPYPTSATLSKRLITEAKRTPERAWLGEVSAVALQQALADADQAFRNFFASLKGRRQGSRMGPPRFKRRTGTQSIRFTRNARFEVLANGRLHLPKVGDLKVAWSRDLPSKPSSVTVLMSPTGKYYASFVVTVEDGTDFPGLLADPEAETGIDLGLKDFAVLRGGKVIENPRFFARLEQKLKKAQRALSRKAKGSQNQAKARLQVAKIHERVKQARSDWIDKQVKTIVAENQGIYVEDLGVKSLSRGRHSKSIQDAAFGMFLTRLESKANRAGRTFVRVDRFFPSTRLCSACGALTGPRGLEGLKVRAWACGCGAFHDRDANAEINIRREGKRMVAEGHSDTRNASGQDVRPGTLGRPGNPRKGKNEEPDRSRSATADRKPGIPAH
ncbi:RNA-guided endonuclease InsQ/TnpB family protein [Glycomyces harbinensis]|uniref:Putative transposase n=1 Tax=Glycomyces harbinensis TaxID=58114 RepID=A0A1G6SZQ7_9ACTN|nr:RNA-guided endonuclease TnpB family protein [Glycomyces harbinensis]SDD22243.1 putative transposase [Glycomyces harbinensis]